MGLFDFIKSKRADQPKTKNAKTDFTSALDEIEKLVFAPLKPLGFKKKGRTLNREIEKGIFQVINFQAGQYPIGENYEVPGLRENLYGKFAVNLGVCVDSLYRLQYPDSNKTFYKEYECQIRIRLGTLLKGQNYWWSLGNNIEEIAEEINKGILTAGKNWFDRVNSKGKIIENLGNPPYRFSPSSKLDAALIVWLDDKEKGTELFNNYLKAISDNHKGHRNYVEELAKKLAIETH